MNSSSRKASGDPRLLLSSDESLVIHKRIREGGSIVVEVPGLQSVHKDLAVQASDFSEKSAKSERRKGVRKAAGKACLHQQEARADCRL